MTQGSDQHAIIHLPLGDRSYDIVIKGGALSELGSYVAPHLKNKRVFVVTEETVAGFYKEQVTAALDREDISQKWFTLTPGEGTKNFSVFEKLLNDMLGAGIERKDIILALGGGVIGDLAGFTAASVLRGINFIQVPTTLLSQVDSSVGGKTGINTPYGKNLVGAFHQPKAVVIDPYVLNTLPKREVQAGYAEVVKYGLIDDPAFFEWLEENGHALISGENSNQQLAAQIYAIEESCKAKARIVAEDERESGKRALLNLGHTFGHALEAECGYDGTLLHGEGVGIGMVMALDLSTKLGLADTGEKTRLVKHLKSVGMKAFASEIGVELNAKTLMAHMTKDKKAEAGDIGFIVGGIGKAEMRRGIDLDLVEAVLQNSINGK